MPFRYSILSGPGHHDRMIIDFLRDDRYDFLSARYYPSFRIARYQQGKEGTTQTSAFYDGFSELVWGLSARVPFIRRKQLHTAATFFLYDRIVRKKLSKAEFLLAWPQVSLLTMRAFRAQEKKIWLEYPLIHCQEWQDIIQSEYDKWGIRERTSLFSEYMLEKMQREIALADRVNVLSSFAASSFKRNGFPAERLSVTPLAVDHEYFISGPERKSGKLIFLFVGRLEILKGIPYLLEAFKKLRTEQAELWLAGPMNADSERFIKKVPESVKVLGSLNRQQLRQIYQQAHVLVLPSVQESFGMVMLEAMACGLPVIATANTGAPDVLTEGKDGFIVSAADPVSLEERMHEFLNDPGLSGQMGMQARERIESFFTLGHYKERFLTNLKSFTEGNRGGDSVEEF